MQSKSLRRRSTLLAACDSLELRTLFAIPSFTQAPQDTPLNYTATQFVTADFDGDGNLDFAATGSDTTSYLVGVFYGDGTGSFTLAPSGVVRINAGIFLTTGDFNADGKTDLAVSGTDTNSIPNAQVSILLNNGDRTFQAPLAYAAIGSQPWRIVSADFNNDGHSDVAIANRDTNDVNILLANADGSLQSPTSVAVGVAPTYIVAGDFNHDGKANDLAVSDVGTGNNDADIKVLISNGSGSFNTPINVLLPNTTPGPLLTGDLDADGKTDIISAAASGGDIEAHQLATGFGTNITASNPTPVLADDFNGDGKLDIAAGGVGGLTVYPGQNFSSFDYNTSDANSVNLTNATPIAEGDFNHDGLPDIFGAVGGNTVRVFLNSTDTAPPTSTFNQLPATTTNPSLALSWSGTDNPGGSGIVSYSVYVSEDNGPFNLTLQTSGTSSNYNGEIGHSYGFYVVATDSAGNTESKPATAETTTTITSTTGDTTRPTSSVDPLPETESTTDFIVSWSGSDNTGGSGIVSYSLFVSDNDAPYTLNLQTSQTSTTFVGLDGHTYRFYTTATDAAGNTENPPNSSDAITTVDLSGGTTTPPAPDTTIGGLDLSFGNGTGSVTVTISNATITSIDAIPSGKGILTAGYDAANNTIIFSKFAADGSFDTTFGTGGIVRSPVPASFTVDKVQFAADGNLYVLGTSSLNSERPNQPAIARYTSSTGAQDAAFAVVPLAAFSPGDTFSAFAVTTDKSGNTTGFLVGGTTTLSGSKRIVIASLALNGSFNSKFGDKATPGYVSRSTSGAATDISTIDAITTDSKGNIYATGATGTTADASLFVTSYSSKGKANKKFPDQTLKVQNYITVGKKIILLPAGKTFKVLVTAALADSATGIAAGAYGAADIRFNSNGALDSKFGSNGISLIAAPPSVTSSSTRSLSANALSEISTQALVPSVTDINDAPVAATAPISTDPGQNQKVRSVAVSNVGSDSTLTETQLVSDAIDISVTPLTTKTGKPFPVGKPITATVTFSNIGTLSTPKTNVPVTLYLSKDATLDTTTDDKQILQATNINLLPGKSKKVNLKFTINTAGTYYLFAVTNSGQTAFSEVTVANNNSTDPTNPITVQSAATLPTTSTQLLSPLPTQSLFSSAPLLA